MKLNILLFVLGVVMFANSSSADMCPDANYALYTPVAGDGSLSDGVWTARRPADEG